MTILNFLSIFVAASNIIIGLFVWLSNVRSNVKFVFFLLTLSIAGWIVTNWITYYSLDFSVIDLNGGLTYAFSCAIVPLFFSFIYLFVGKKEKEVGTLIGLFSSWLFAVFFAAASLFTEWVQIKPIIVKPHLATIEQGPLYPFFFAFFIIYILWAFIILIAKYKSVGGIEKQKIKYLLLGFGVAAFFGVMGNLILVGISNNDSFEAQTSLIGPLFTLIMVAFTAYALFRYRLFNINLVIRQSIVRVISFAIIFGVYLFAILSLKDSINPKSQSEQTTFLVIVTLVVVLTIEPIRKLVNSIVDKAFESRDKKQQEAQAKIRLTLKSQQNIENLTESICNYLKSIFNLEEVHFIEKGDLFFDKHRETKTFLQSMGRILIPEELPYRVEESEKYFFINKELQGVRESAFLTIGQDDLFMGCFALGKRKNNKAYTVEEVRELKRLQDDFTEALLNARLYQQAIARIKI